MIQQIDPKKGIMISIHPETKNLIITEWDLPIQQNSATVAWALDMIRALKERNYLWKWLLRFVMGRYAYRELVGLRDSLEKTGHNTDFGYELNEMDYHKDKVKL